MLPKFGHMRPVGSIYTTLLNVWPRNFDEGFLNVTDQFEGFAIEYTGRFRLENSGHFGFSLLADNGAKLYLDNKLKPKCPEFSSRNLPVYSITLGTSVLAC